MANKRNGILVYALLLTAAFSFRVAVARLLPNDDPFDGKVYTQLARNVLEQHSYSHATEPPYDPSLIRLPGYPLFIAGVYSVFGHGDDTSVRIVQALLDTATCALIALIAFLWEPVEKLKRRSSIAALALAALCPFTTIYVATILTETGTTFLALAMCFTATLAFKATRQGNALLLWGATGVLAGVAVLFRPDSGLFALAVGITLVVTTLLRSSDVKLSRKREEVLYRFSRASYLGAVFSLAFCLVLVPWTVRNFRVFHIFQPLAPVHAEMPGEFVPRGYLSWLRTWIDDGRYIGPVLWSLDESPIKLDDIPDRAFDSAEEKQRVAALFEKYNHPPEVPELISGEPEPQETPTPSDDLLNPNPDSSAKSDEEEPAESDQGDEAHDSDEAGEVEKGDEAASSDDASADQAVDQPVEITPEIDAGFAEIAKQRVARHPLRYYFLLPAKRAVSIWFNTHSQYYPFEGELLPFANLDDQRHQQFWLPLFAVLTLVYTLLGVAGGWFLWERRGLEARQWVLLAALMIFLRIGFFATLENPEPRYVVEVFPFLSILGGIALTRFPVQIRGGQIYLQNRER
ncbi:MAG: glycosyltransferase family 39 protein [Pyrinomonadaceae bacterium]